MGDRNKLSSDEIVKLLIGLIGDPCPNGDEDADKKALQNLEVMTSVCDWLLDEILFAARHHDSIFHSSAEVGKTAMGYIKSISDWSNWNVNELEAESDSDS